jgi:hypothetical protein
MALVVAELEAELVASKADENVSPDSPEHNDLKLRLRQARFALRSYRQAPSVALATIDGLKAGLLDRAEQTDTDEYRDLYGQLRDAQVEYVQMMMDRGAFREWDGTDWQDLDSEGVAERLDMLTGVNDPDDGDVIAKPGPIASKATTRKSGN